MWKLAINRPGNREASDIGRFRMNIIPKCDQDGWAMKPDNNHFVYSCNAALCTRRYAIGGGYYDDGQSALSCIPSKELCCAVDGRPLFINSVDGDRYSWECPRDGCGAVYKGKRMDGIG